MNAILIYSGGLDSTTLLYEYRDEIRLAVTFEPAPGRTAPCSA